MQSYDFTMQRSGRDGNIRCTDGRDLIDIYWEMSGSSDYDILLAPLDLRSWASGAEIPRTAQRQILSALRDWLSKQEIRSDVARPCHTEQQTGRCQWSDCTETAVAGVAYCAFHYDENLLR